MRNQLLRDTDWAGMAHSLEVRTPLVDSVLLKRIAAVRLPRAGISLKTVLARTPTQPLPESVIRRDKTGFGIPMGHWISRRHSAVAQSAFVHARRWARYLATRYLAGRPPAGDAVLDAFA